ncbi:hypothetical protein GOBAR_AA11121 [Gossypium barbadense]|uniref:SWIM-type domain-containing protein n=1 Tax=Gossypium barbadense TaxID=3634 RepID=A0A2P5Y1Q8_GOSBA|nr:hypothetical protein GOBAR_AA11121 [Gossypium barbadense]
MSHFSIRSHFDMLVNNLSESFNKMILEARRKPILTMIETVRTNIMLLIVKKKEEAEKWKGMLCPKIRKKLNVNIKDSLRCVPSHVGKDKYQVECSLSSQHVVGLVENSYSCRNWDLTGISCIHALAVTHLKDKFSETYVQTWYTKQTQLDIYSNFIRPVKGPKQWVSLSNMLPILLPTLRRPPGQKTQRWCSQPSGCLYSATGYPKSTRECPNLTGCPNSVTNCPTYQQPVPTHQKDVAPREKLSFKRKPTTIRWIPPTQKSSMTDQ